eukprot:611415-Rhodomonas_salina.2
MPQQACPYFLWPSLPPNPPRQCPRLPGSGCLYDTDTVAMPFRVWRRRNRPIPATTGWWTCICSTRQCRRENARRRRSPAMPAPSSSTPLSTPSATPLLDGAEPTPPPPLASVTWLYSQSERAARNARR